VESHRPLDAPGPSAARTLRLVFSARQFAFPLLLSVLAVLATAAEPTTAVVNLYEQKRWPEVVSVAQRSHGRSPDLAYLHGMALAHLERWTEAKEVFSSGYLDYPRDKRFPLELAALAYRSKDFGAAKSYLHAALKLDAGESYANDFLGTIYLLEGNLEASLKYWNRIGKPYIRRVQLEPLPQLDPALLQRTFTFSVDHVLTTDQLDVSRANLDRLAVFSHYQFDLGANERDHFDLNFHAMENTSKGKLARLVPLLSGLPYETVYADFVNVGHSATNLATMWRWDAQKRRLFAALSGPLAQNPSWEYRLSSDGRWENWDVSTTLHGAGVPLRQFQMNKLEAGAQLEYGVTGRLRWINGFSIAQRSFRNAGTGPLFGDGLSVQQQTGVVYDLIRIPERRITVSSSVDAQIGKMLTARTDVFSRLQGSASLRWLPQAQGDDFAVSADFKTGKTFGPAPFDELFMLGMDRDNNLWLRSQPGTRGGKKGSAPMGRDYVLMQAGIEKTAYRNEFLSWQAGPFYDFGRVYDSSHQFGSDAWLHGVGIQSKVRVPGGVAFLFSYGIDPRTGRGTFFTTVSH
jgi:tetratricopeptide (TPR) repeat protein